MAPGWKLSARARWAILGFTALTSLLALFATLNDESDLQQALAFSNPRKLAQRFWWKRRPAWRRRHEKWEAALQAPNEDVHAMQNMSEPVPSPAPGGESPGGAGMVPAECMQCIPFLPCMDPSTSASANCTNVPEHCSSTCLPYATAFINELKTQIFAVVGPPPNATAGASGFKLVLDLLLGLMNMGPMPPNVPPRVTRAVSGVLTGFMNGAKGGGGGGGGGCKCFANGAPNEPFCESGAITDANVCAADSRCHWGPGEDPKCAAMVSPGGGGALPTPMPSPAPGGGPSPPSSSGGGAPPGFTCSKAAADAARIPAGFDSAKCRAKAKVFTKRLVRMFPAPAGCDMAPALAGFTAIQNCSDVSPAIRAYCDSVAACSASSSPTPAPPSAAPTPPPPMLANPPALPAGVCASWCGRNAAPWATKCGWGQCYDCQACASISPAPSPPAVLPNCASWCAGSSMPWATKCGWGKCYGCASCASLSPAPSPPAARPNCANWCSGNAQPWSKKCGWGKCHGCSDCSS